MAKKLHDFNVFWPIWGLHKKQTIRSYFEIITSAKKLMFWQCLFVCLFAGFLKTFMNLLRSFGEVGDDLRNCSLDSGWDRDLHLDPDIVVKES